MPTKFNFPQTNKTVFQKFVQANIHSPNLSPVS